ncbi:YbhN family protein [Bacteroidota bacterium]
MNEENNSVEYDVTQLPTNTAVPEEPESRSFTGRRAFWPILLSLLVLVLIGWLTWEPGALGEFVRAVNLWLILAAAALLVLRVFVGGYRLKYSSQHRLTYSASVRGQIIWDFASSVTPSVIGGAPVAAILMARDDQRPVGEITAVMLFAMLMDQIWFAIAVFILVTASVFVDIYPDSLGTVGASFFTMYFVAMMVWASFFAYSTLVRPELLQTMVRWIFRLKFLKRFEERVELELENWKARAIILRSQPIRFYMYGIIFAAIAWTFRYLVLFLIVSSVYRIPDVVQFIARTMAMLHLALILPTPGGSGGIEGMYVLFFTEPLIPKGFLAPTLLVWRFLSYYVTIAVGLVITTHVLDRWSKRKPKPQ